MTTKTIRRKPSKKQVAKISESDLSAIIRPEENLERWSDFLFPHPKAEGLSEPRKMEFETKLNNEDIVASITIKPSTAQKAYTCNTYDVYLALVNIWEKKNRPEGGFKISISDICRELELKSNGVVLKRLIEECNKLLMTYITWTLSYKGEEANNETVQNQTILKKFDYITPKNRLNSKETQYNKTCEIEFHEKILANLQSNRTIPINFSARKNISQPIAKVLYNKVDKILYSTRRPYSRKALKLVSDLNLKPDRYKHKSQRKALVQTLEENLNGKMLSNMKKLVVEACETVDGTDWKLTFKSTGKNAKKKNKLKIINYEEHIISDLVAQIVNAVGHEKRNKNLYRLFAVHYPTNAIFRAVGEYKERLEGEPVSTKPAMFTAILHRIIHDMGFEWINDCGSNCKYRP